MGASRSIIAVALVITLWTSPGHCEEHDTGGDGKAIKGCTVDGQTVDVSPASKELKWASPPQERFNLKKRSKIRGAINHRCFHGQHGEDLVMFERFFHGISGGFFIELGALDGYSFSASFFFERYQHWKGLLIEASPPNQQQFRRISAARSPMDRRRATFIDAAICAEPKSLTYVMKSGTGAGILEFMPPHEKARADKECSKKESLGANERPVGSQCWLTPIRCVNLGQLLQQQNVSRVDMFVLDVEGAELDVLKAMDLTKVDVRFFIVELEGEDKPKDAAVRCHLLQHGYRSHGRIGLNEVWEKTKYPMGNAVVERQYSAVPSTAYKHCFVSDPAKALVTRPYFDGDSAPTLKAYSAARLPKSSGGGGKSKATTHRERPLENDDNGELDDGVVRGQPKDGGRGGVTIRLGDGTGDGERRKPQADVGAIDETYVVLLLVGGVVAIFVWRALRHRR